MSDFDTVLERLVGDPAFAAALAADPSRALAGYQLSPDEADLLRSQVTGDTGGQTRVETRANQSSVFGMLAPLTGMSGIAEAVGLGHPTGAGGVTGFGQAPRVGLGEAATAGVEGFGPAGGAGHLGTAGGVGHFTPTGGAGQLGAGGGTGHLGAAGYPATEGGTGHFGAAGGAGTGTAGFGEPAGTPHLGAAPGPGPRGGLAGMGDSIGDQMGGRHAAPPEGYHTRVDVDGDGHWDRHTLHGRADGGVDIHVDLNHDGRTDFIGHDDDADGLVDSADYDKDRDGFFEKSMYDDNGDGWLDRTVRHHRPPADPPDDGGPIGRTIRGSD